MPIRLNKRERYAVWLGAFAILAFVLFQLVVGPLFARQDRLRQALEIKQNALKEMIALQVEYQALSAKAKGDWQRITGRSKDFTLFSFLDGLTGKAGVKDRVSYMKPSTIAQKNLPYRFSVVEMELKEITMKQLADYLYLVESSPNLIKVKRLSVTKAGNAKEFINAVMQVETIEPDPGSA